MPRRNDERIDDIPSIILDDDDRQRETYSSPPVKAKSSSGGGVAWLALLLGLAATGGAGYLYTQLELTQKQLLSADARVATLEDMLSANSEDASESAAVQAVKIKELTSEVDKLWASAWRKNKARLDGQNKDIKAAQVALSKASKLAAANSSALTGLNEQLPKLQSLSSNVKDVQSLSIAQKAQLSELDDSQAALSTKLGALNKRVLETEDWVKSINAYRRQMNQKIAELEARQQPQAAGL